MSTTNLISKGQAALKRYAWQEACGIFETSLKKEETPEALEGLANAAAWLYDSATQLDARERAYKLYRQRGDADSASRMATWLAGESLQTHGAAITNDWLQRAHRILNELEPSPAHAFLAAMETHVTLMTRNDPVGTKKHAGEAIRLTKKFNLTDIKLEPRTVK